jgi:spoIIIJ-associated protein
VTDQNTSETEHDVTETASDEQSPSSTAAPGEESIPETGSDAPTESDAATSADAPSDSDGSDDSDDADSAGSDDTDGSDADSDVDRLENEGDIAADYLEELLDIADLDGDLDMDVEGDRASVSIVGGDVSTLIGRNGEVLEALQELTRLAVYRETGERSRLMLDIGGFRADKRSRLEKVADEAVAEVRSSGERKVLDPMSPFERKVVHDAVAAAGLSSESEGEEPRRRVVVLPS